MPSDIQQTLRAALAADTQLTARVSDRIFPGEVPDDETPSPWLFFAVPESVPIDALDDADGIDVRSEVEFHALARTYAEARAIIADVTRILKSYSSSAVKRSLWAGSSEEQTEDGYHHAARFVVFWLMS